MNAATDRDLKARALARYLRTHREGPRPKLRGTTIAALGRSRYVCVETNTRLCAMFRIERGARLRRLARYPRSIALYAGASWDPTEASNAAP